LLSRLRGRDLEDVIAIAMSTTSGRWSVERRVLRSSFWGWLQRGKKAGEAHYSILAPAAGGTVLFAIGGVAKSVILAWRLGSGLLGPGQALAEVLRTTGRRRSARRDEVNFERCELGDIRRQFEPRGGSRLQGPEQTRMRNDAFTAQNHGTVERE